MYVYGASSDVLENVATKLDGLRLQRTFMFSAKAVDSLYDKMHEDLLALRHNLGVDVDIAENRVTISGFGTNATIAVKLAKKLVEEFESNAKSSNTNASVTLPKEWSKMTSSEMFKSVALKRNEVEFVSVITKFAAESGLQTKNVTKIDRIQNTVLYTQYESKKRQMESSRGKNVERILWHGTSANDVDNINKFGFYKSVKTGASHGVGVYFDVNASMLVRGNCQPDTTGHKHVYLAHVLTGDYAVGSQGTPVPS